MNGWVPYKRTFPITEVKSTFWPYTDGLAEECRYAIDSARAEVTEEPITNAAIRANRVTLTMATQTVALRLAQVKWGRPTHSYPLNAATTPDRHSFPLTPIIGL